MNSKQITYGIWFLFVLLSVLWSPTFAEQLKLQSGIECHWAAQHHHATNCSNSIVRMVKQAEQTAHTRNGLNQVIQSNLVSVCSHHGMINCLQDCTASVCPILTCSISAMDMPKLLDWTASPISRDFDSTTKPTGYPLFSHVIDRPPIKKV